MRRPEAVGLLLCLAAACSDGGEVTAPSRAPTVAADVTASLATTTVAMVASVPTGPRADDRLRTIADALSFLPHGEPARVSWTDFGRLDDLAGVERPASITHPSVIEYVGAIGGGTTGGYGPIVEGEVVLYPRFPSSPIHFNGILLIGDDAVTELGRDPLIVDRFAESAAPLTDPAGAYAGGSINRRSPHNSANRPTAPGSSAIPTSRRVLAARCALRESHGGSGCTAT